MAIDYEKGMRPNLYELMQGGGGGGYVLPPATADTLGGVKVGNGIDVEPDGTISITDSEKVFIAEVDVTTFAEVRGALENGKTVLLKLEPDAAPVLRGVAVNRYNNIYVFVQFVSQEALGAGGKLVLSSITLDSNDVWGTSQTFVQKELVSGESLKTVNGQTLLGAGNIEVGVDKLNRNGRNAEYPFVMQMSNEDGSVTTISLQSGDFYIGYSGYVNSSILLDRYGNINALLTDDNNENSFEIAPNGITIGTRRNGGEPYDGLKLIGVTSPVNELDAVNKQYVDDSVQAMPKHFKEFTSDYTGLTNTRLFAITNATPASSQTTGRFDVTLPDNADYADYYVAGISKFEFFNGNTRVEAIPVNIFSMNGSKTVRCAFKTSGSESAQITKAAITINVYRRG